MNEPAISEEHWHDRDWTPTCKICQRHFPGEGLPPDSNWVCPQCVIDKQVEWQPLYPPPKAFQEQYLQHYQRFRHVSERYPRRVAAAYHVDADRFVPHRRA
jgi:hypothetical protein